MSTRKDTHKNKKKHSLTHCRYANVRTTKSAMGSNGWTDSFNTAFRAGGVMGFSLCGLALLVLYITIEICKSAYKDDLDNNTSFVKKYQAYMDLFECVAGFGLGGSSIAMFGRVGGGIYTKAADVGADLAGKVVHGVRVCVGIHIERH